MYHLLKGLYLYATSKEEYSVLLLGLDNAGKTTLLNQIKALFLPPSEHRPNIDPSKTVPTVGQNVSTITLPDLYLKIWDVGGQHSLRKLWQSYYSSCHAIVFVIDSTDVGDGDIEKIARRHGMAAGTSPSIAPSGARGTTSKSGEGSAGQEGQGEEEDGMDEGQLDIGRLEECRLVLEDVLLHSETEGVPLLVLANKQDREDCLEVVRIKEGLVRKVFEGERGHSVRDSRVLPVSALSGTGVKEAVEWLCSRVRWNKEARPPVMR